MGLVPLTERSSVNDNNGVLDKGLGTDELIVGRVVDDVNDMGLTSNGLRAPREVAGVETESAVLLVSSADANGVDSLRAELGHGSRASQLELSLHADRVSLTARGAALMPVVTRDTHFGV